MRRKSPVQSRRGTEQFERVLRRELLQNEELHGTPFLCPEPFAKFAEYWLEVRAKPVNRPSTYQKKRETIRRRLVPAFGELPLHAITEEKITNFISHLAAHKLGPKTKVNILSMLRSMLLSAYHWGYIRRIPSFPRISVPEAQYKYLSTEEAQRLVAATSPGYWRTLIVFLLHTGCRFGEAAALPWEAVTLEGPSPRVRISASVWNGSPGPTKNGRCRTIPLSAELQHELAAFREESATPYVFALPSGALPNATRTREHLARLCERAGVPRVSWHVLRHTFATELSNRHVPIRVVQELLGHASLSMTARYAHVGGEGVRAAVNRLPKLAVTTYPRHSAEEMVALPRAS